MREPGLHCCRIAGRIVVGIDEVGRGCIAGHVTAAAVWFPDVSLIPEGVDDSKRVTELRRPLVAAAIRAVAHVAVGHASLEEIEELNILMATHLAMRRAWQALNAPADALVIVDGGDVPWGIDGEAVAMPRADASCPTVAAASIIAKVHRDEAMIALAGEDDLYGWRDNKGYGTPAHIAALQAHGVSVHHRRGFAPVRQMVKAGRRA